MSEKFIFKTSNAIIKPQVSNYPVWIMEDINPENYLIKALQDFMAEIQFSLMYPNFGNVRVGAVHPFALLLFQEVLGQKIDLSVFPAITIADNSEGESSMELGRDRTQFMISKDDVAEMTGHRNAGRLIISDAALARLTAAIATRDLPAEHAMYSSQHTVNINIWAENRDITNVIYDMVLLFVNFSRRELHNSGIDLLEAITGNRTGDVNMDFGSLLYGSNITLPCNVRGGAMRVEIPVGVEAMEHFDTHPPMTNEHYHINT